MEVLNRFLSRLTEFARSLTPGARLAAGALIAVVAVSLYFLSARSSSEADVYLLDGVTLNSSQLNSMQAAFAKKGLVTYEIDGGRIRTPRSERAAYVAALAESG